MAIQRRYRHWNYILAWTIVGAFFVDLLLFPLPLRRWPWFEATYVEGVATGYPRFDYGSSREGNLIRPNAVADSWISFEGSPQRYRCHVAFRVKSCPNIATGRILRRNDRVTIRYIEDTRTGERFITQLDGRSLRFRCDPRRVSLPVFLGFGRFCRRVTSA